MKQKQKLVAALAITALAAIGSPATAEASTTAGTTILNIVKVDYKDASGTNSFAADASTIVTVNLVESGLSITNAPFGDSAPPSLSCLSLGSYPSGSTVSRLYALTATANGVDNYSLTMTNTNNLVTPVPPATSTMVYNTLTYTGANDGLSTTGTVTRALGSAIPTGIVDDLTLEFPGGALAGFAENDIVVVNTEAGQRAYLVTGVSPGLAPVYSNGGNTPHTSIGDMTQAEEKGILTLGAYGVQSLILNGVAVDFGGGMAPALNTAGKKAVLGVPVGEMILVRADVTASTNTFNAGGDVDFTLTTHYGDPANVVTAVCKAGIFTAPNLSIMKEARNFSAGGSFGPSATGNPGQILEYRVTVTNAGGQAAKVTVTDAVPVYTTLVAGSAYGTVGSAAATDIFAQADKNAGAPVNLTVKSDDNESSAVASGNGTIGSVLAGQTLTFYVGTDNTNAAGGTVDNAPESVYHIYYRVKID